MKNQPVFIVGVQRSGTTLLAAQLSAHRRLSCGPETHFFRWLSKIDVDEICKPQTWPTLAIDFLSSIRHRDFTGSSNDTKYLVDKYQIDRKQIDDYLQNTSPSVYSLLSCLTESYARQMGKRRWVEKTPDHIEHVHLIRKHFPDSPIIRLIRDPRDVALSLMNVPWGTKTFVEGLLRWKQLDDASATFFKADPLSYTLRFEDLLVSTEETLRDLCQFIGEAFEEEMLDTSETGRHVNSQQVPWKDKARQPIDSSRLAVWRKNLTDSEKRLAEAILGDRLEAYGYPREVHFSQFGLLYPALQMAIDYVEELELMAARGIRFWQMTDGERPAAQIYLGNPGYTNWLGEKKSRRVFNTLMISKRITQALLHRRSVYWIPAGDEGRASSYCGQFLKMILEPCKVSASTSTNWTET